MKKSPKSLNKKSFIKNHKILSFFIALVILIFLVYAGFQIYLYVKFLIGNDIVIRLDSDKSDINIPNKQLSEINLKMSAVTSPLCKTYCEYSLTDLATNQLSDKQNFSLNSKTKEYTLTAENGRGQILYRVSLSCHNVQGLFCHTKEYPVLKDLIITLEHDLNENQINQSNQIQSQIQELYNQIQIKQETLNYISNKSQQIQNTLAINQSITPDVNINQTLTEIISLWKTYQYDLAQAKISTLNISLDNFTQSFNEANTTFYLTINQYNNLIESLNPIYNKLESLRKSLSDNQTAELNIIIDNFNNKIKQISQTTNLAEKQNISTFLLNINLSKFQPITTNNSAKEIIFNLSNITLTPITTTANLSLEENPEECCLRNNCTSCSSNRNTNYPIIFVHGHDFNQGVSAEYSLNAFQGIQQQLDSEYLNAGELTLGTLIRDTSGLLGLINKPVSFRVTYYYDSFKSPNSIIPVQTKSDNLDTYSIRMRDIIENVKYETGKDKVIVIAHSMGGLVSRRYLQIFGNSSIDRMILIGTPNKGIVGDIQTYCSILGASLECTDLNAGSLFLNKLNNERTDKVKTFNIIGTGCNMNGEDGDGIVLAKNAILPGSIEYQIHGNCSTIDFLHNNMLDLSKYPQTLEAIKGILQNN